MPFDLKVIGYVYVLSGGRWGGVKGWALKILFLHLTTLVGHVGPMCHMDYGLEHLGS